MRVLVTGASRGIGAATARAFAQHHGSRLRIALLGRSLEQPSHHELNGTLLETARAVRASGGHAHAYRCDMRDPGSLQSTLDHALFDLRGLDVLINNASVLMLNPMPTAREMDLVHSINTMGTLICLNKCMPHLEQSRGSIVTMAPPVLLHRLDWVRQSPSYTMSKYSMTMHTLSCASNLVSANCLWPKRTVATAATEFIERSGHMPGAYSKGRAPQDVARAIYQLATSRAWNAQCLFDEDIVNMEHSDAPLDAFVEFAPSNRHRRK